MTHRHQRLLRKSLLPAAVSCAIVVTGGLTTAHATAAPAVHAQPTPVSPVAATALANISAANTGYGPCNTGPGVQCKVVYIMSTGTSSAIAYAYGPNGPVTSNPVVQSCGASTCTKAATATPSPGVTVNYWQVTGPNISVICSGPVWYC